MTYHGKLSEFDSTSEDWPSYVERMEQYFAANDVGDETKKRAILLSVCGSSTYRLIRSLLAPVKPGEKSYSDIVALVTTHLNPKPSVIVQRFKFNCRVRGEVEPIADFVAALRALSEHCEFGMSLEDVLRDRLVCGINNQGCDSFSKMICHCVRQFQHLFGHDLSLFFCTNNIHACYSYSYN